MALELLGKCSRNALEIAYSTSEARIRNVTVVVGEREEPIHN